MERRNMIPKTSTDWRGRISTVGRLDLHCQNQSNPLMLIIGSSQIKNMVAATHALAVYHNIKVSMSHLELVINLNAEFESDFGGAGQAFSKFSYL